MIALCENCCPTWSDHEVLTIVPLSACAQCGRLDNRYRAGLRVCAFRSDPRVLGAAPKPEPAQTIETSAFEIAMRGLAIIRDGAGKLSDLGDGEGPVLLDAEACGDLADSFIALALRVAREADPFEGLEERFGPDPEVAAERKAAG